MRAPDAHGADDEPTRRRARRDRELRSSAGTGLDPEPFRVEIHRERGRIRVLPIGELDLSSVGIVEEQLAELHDAGCDHVVVDLHRVSFMDSSGLRMMIAAARRADLAGRHLRVVGAHGQVMRLCELTGVSSELGI